MLRGTLRQYLRFVLPTTDRNNAGWPTAKWWEILLDNIDKLKLTISKESKSIEQMSAWVDCQVVPTMATRHNIWLPDLLQLNNRAIQ